MGPATARLKPCPDENQSSQTHGRNLAAFAGRQVAWRNLFRGGAGDDILTVGQRHMVSAAISRTSCSQADDLMARKSVKMSLRARLALRKAAGFALVFLCALLCFGSGGKAAVLSPGGAAAYSHTKVSSRFAIADFDGDSRPDLATVEMGQTSASRARYWIGFQLSTGAPQGIGVNAPIGGLDIASRDVNGDHSLDLIVTTTWLNQPVAVLLNDGHGNFTLTDPAAFPTLVWSAEKIWNVGRLDVKDTGVAVLP